MRNASPYKCVSRILPLESLGLLGVLVNFHLCTILLCSSNDSPSSFFSHITPWSKGHLLGKLLLSRTVVLSSHNPSLLNSSWANIRHQAVSMLFYLRSSVWLHKVRRYEVGQGCASQPNSLFHGRSTTMFQLYPRHKLMSSFHFKEKWCNCGVSP